MLSAYIQVPRGADPTGAAAQALLHEAHLKRVHLARPLTPRITPMSGSVRQIASMLGIDRDEDRDFYRVDSDTVPCPTA